MKAYTSKKSILDALENGVKFIRTVKSDTLNREYVTAVFKNNKNTEDVNLNSYKALVKDGSIAEKHLGYRDVSSVWGVNEYEAVLNSKEKLTTITNYVNYKGGINNLKSVSVISGFLTLATFTGKTATTRAKSYIKKFKR